MKNRRHLLKSLAGCLIASAVVSAQAQDGAFPVRPVRLVVSTSAGGMTDILARLYADKLSKTLKQPFVVENMPGASTMLASRYVARQAADGYTLLVAANTIATLPHVEKNAGYQMKDFVGIGELARSPSLLVVSGSSKMKTIPELVAAAKRNPGVVTYAYTGRGTTSHMTAELFARDAGVSFNGIAYKGISLAVPDVLAGRVDFLMGPSTSTEELTKSGKMRALAITSWSRSPAFPNVPTFRELGYPDATYNLFFGIFAPAAIPDAVRKTLADAMDLAKQDPTFTGRLRQLGMEVSNVRTPEQFDAFLRQEEEKSVSLLRK
ncbi:Bug family tripartite tricarboxylate transporter substrate binding protein [Cupriavidus lacunae]|nr:tripartite tricarboxylate transporter substrate binding protein [Cupriavidus lacunae]